jgi:hypothetical protein
VREYVACLCVLDWPAGKPLPSGIVERCCVHCQTSIYLAPSSLDLIARGVVPLCGPCAQKLAGFTEAVMTSEAETEYREYLARYRAIAGN